MRTYRFWIIAIGFAACMPLARAGDVPLGLNPALNDTLFVGVGAFFPKTTGQVQLNSATLGVGTVVDFQNTLGMSTQPTAPDAAVRIRLSERWRIEASYFQFTTTGDKAIDQDIQWGDLVYPVNTQVTSKLQFADLRVSAGYSFYKTSDKELGVGLGLHTLGYKATLTSLNFGSEQGKVLAPLPVLSIYGGFALNDQWSVSARLDRFSLTYDQYSGGITAMGVDLLYQPFRHVGFGLGYHSLLVNFQATSGDFVGKFDQDLQGPAAYLTVSF